MAWRHHDSTQQLPGQDTLKIFFDSHLILLCGILLATPAISILFDVLEAVARALRERASLEAAEFSTVLSAIDEIVGLKQKRIGRLAVDLSSQNPTKGTVFEKITQPTIQMSHIVEKLYLTLRQLTGDDSLKIVLVEVQNGKPVRYIEHMPSDSKPEDDLLTKNAAATLFGRVAASNKEIIITDIPDHVAAKNDQNSCNYFVDDPASVPDGSIMGIPLFHPYLNVVAYVLTIKSDAANRINKAFKKKFNKIIRMFTSRILFEHSLLQLKNNSH